MAALHSSSALAVNTFDFWSGKSLRPVTSALGLHGDAQTFKFEAQFPTGLDGSPPNLDLAFYCAGDHVVGVESKFSEWLTPKSAAKPCFKEKYFPRNGSLWAEVGLPGAQELAAALHDGRERFRHLDAAQLLKHMLGLGTAAPGRFTLHYLFYDWPSPQSRLHEEELTRFAQFVGRDAPFSWSTYQDTIAALAANGAADQAYLGYLQRRYLSNAA